MAVGVAQFTDFQKANASLVEGGFQFTAPQAILILDHAAGALGQHADGLGGGAAIEGAFDDVALDLLFEASYADLEKLVEIGTDDAEKLHPFEQWSGGVKRFLEDALIELQPAQFAAQKVFGGESAAHEIFPGTPAAWCILASSWPAAPWQSHHGHGWRNSHGCVTLWQRRRLPSRMGAFPRKGDSGKNGAEEKAT
jgi:hypothetical protein